MKKVTCFRLSILSQYLLLSMVICAQPIPSQTLKVGDRMPDLTVKVMNAPTDSIRLSSFRGKVVILDLWSHGCISCLENFPKLQQMQQQFNGQVQFILVNQESEAKNNAFFAKYPNVVKPDVPMVSDGRLFWELFPHTGLPYHIWIDPDGVIRYTTGSENTTSGNIERFLKKDYFYAHNFSKKKFTGYLFDSAVVKSLTHFSYLGHCMFNYRLQNYAVPEFEQMVVNCGGLAGLYQRAFTFGRWNEFNRPGRTIIEVRDSSHFFGPKDPSLRNRWNEENTYNYHVQVPKNEATNIYPIFQQDLERAFPYTAAIELRAVPCLVLVNIGDTSILKSKGGTSVDSFFKLEVRSKKFEATRCMRNIPFTFFTERFLGYVEVQYKLPVVDATTFKGFLDICFNGTVIDGTNIDKLRNELRAYHLDLIPMNYPIEVLVIKDKKL